MLKHSSEHCNSHDYYKLDQQNAHILKFDLKNSYKFWASLAHHQGLWFYKLIALYCYLECTHSV